ncbi:MAG: hypothetical protein K2G98_06265, partial [Duncaniella sp.]|nr:hypothetical protein [Duncaniella sp.]
MKGNLLSSLLFASCMLVPGIAMSQQREAFPGAEGYGRYTTGGRGGAVYHVTNLNDSGEGSFRWACEQKGPRTIVFDVDGTIHLKSELKLRNGNVTIAGQTAPGDGVCIAEYPFTISADNVIIRFMRFRPGNKNITEEMANSGACDGWDGLGAIDQKDIIVDHCSVSWSIDECLSFVGCSRTTVQWCIVSQSLVKGHSKLSHGYGGNWGGRKASYHHNLLAHHTSRAPRLGPRPTTQLKEQMDMRNNVIYNYSGEGCYGGEGMKVNIVNNVYIPGPGNKYWSGSNSNKFKRLAAVGVRNNNYVATYPAYAPALHLVGKYYVDGNYHYSDQNVTKDNWTDGVYSQITWSDWDDLANTAAKQAEMKKEIKAETPIEYVYTTTHGTTEAYSNVINYAGASLSRDELDKTIASEARTKTSRTASPASTGSGLDKGFINTQTDVKGLTGGDGWPKLNAGTAKTDTDGDGIPDEWEKANGLNPNDSTDGAIITADGYSNLEHYINSLVQDIVDKGNAGTTAKMLNGTLTTADAAVQLPAYDPNYVPEPDPDDVVTPDPGDEEGVGNSWTANGTEPANKTVVRENITAEFLDNTSKGSQAGVGEWDFSNAKDVRGDQNGLEIKFSPNVPGTLKIVFAAAVANNKSINMFVNGDTKTTLDATLSDGTTVVKSGSFAPNGVDADDYITYELEAGKTYNYYTAGTKWRIRSFEFTPGDLSGFEDIITDSETSTGNGKIYNLMGIEVKGNLTPGIYIR